MKCKFYKENGLCSKGNDPYDVSEMGECIYINGEITEKASIHCSEGIIRAKQKDPDEKRALEYFKKLDVAGIKYWIDEDGTMSFKTIADRDKAIEIEKELS